METLYRKVAISEEPKHNGNYHCIFPEGQIFTITFLKEYGFHDEFTDCSGITHYLEEIPDPTTQLQADKAELLEILNETFLHITPLARFLKEPYQTGLKSRAKSIESLIQKQKK